MSENITELLIDTIFDTCKLINDLIYQCFKKEKTDNFDFNNYFDIVGLFTEYNNEKISPKLIKTVKTNIGYNYHFTIPPGFGQDRLLKYKDGLECAIGNKIEINFEGKHWIIVVIKSELPNNVKYELPQRKCDSILIPIGVSLNNNIEIDLKENPNTFIVGTTGSGKSVCVKSIITSLVNLYTPKEMELYLCDLKRVELNLFRNLEHTKEFVYKVNDVTKVIIDMLEECENRYDLFMKRNVTNIFEYNKITKNKLTFKVLFIEEIVLLLQDKKNVAMNTLKQLLSISRASGIYVFISTQRPSFDVLDNVVKANINNRICFKVEDSKNSIIAIDDVGAESLRGKGHGILKIGSEKTEFQSYFISDEQTKKLINKFIVKEAIKVTSKQLGFKENKKENIEDLSFLDKL